MKIVDMTYWEFMTHGWEWALVIVGGIFFIFALPVIISAIRKKIRDVQ